MDDGDLGKAAVVATSWVFLRNTNKPKPRGKVFPTLHLAELIALWSVFFRGVWRGGAAETPAAPLPGWPTQFGE